MDIITINQLEFKAYIGVEAWEQKIEQKIILDIHIGTDISDAAQSDNIDDTINYSEVACVIEGFLSMNRFYLLESLAEKISELIFKQFKIAWLKLTVSKPYAIAQAKSVALTVERKSQINASVAIMD